MNNFALYHQKSTPGPLLSIVIPTYNERQNIRLLISRLEGAFRLIPHEILVVDDASPDGTAQVVEELKGHYHNLRLLIRRGEKGLGGALRAGYDAAKGEVILSVDADLSFPPDDLPRLYRLLGESYDLVIGSRHSTGSEYEARNLSGRIRRSASSFENAVLRFFFRLPFHDFFANCRAIRKSLWDHLDLEEDSSFFLAEMIISASRARARVIETPVAFMDRKFGSTKINHALEIPKSFGRVIRFCLTRLFRRQGQLSF